MLCNKRLIKYNYVTLHLVCAFWERGLDQLYVFVR